jgi:hypothetical protein
METGGRFSQFSVNPFLDLEPLMTLLVLLSLLELLQCCTHLERLEISGQPETEIAEKIYSVLDSLTAPGLIVSLSVFMSLRFIGPV